MDTVSATAELRARASRARCDGRTVGLVPTMGYLHDGHLSLIERSVAEQDLTVVTIFVNPLQFAPEEDLDAYPRDPDGDAAKAAGAGAGLLFTPSVDEMYPDEVLTTVNVTSVTEGLESGARPSHFSGVATVVTKLFAMVGPCRAYFGEKDYQQLQLTAALARDLSLGVTVVGCPTVRERDGLAMSSRNAYLTPGEREAAPVLHRALRSGQAAIASGETDPATVETLMGEVIDAEPLVTLDYAVVRHPRTIRPLERIDGPVRLLVAAQLPHARLIDNLGAAPGVR
ncbi:MAG TPA: pantoate--beta-alanine ligase [Acidimicrobiales bacterium]